jgi:hypothetical protein
MRLVLALAVCSCYGESVTPNLTADQNLSADQNISHNQKVTKKNNHTVSVKDLAEQNKDGKLTDVDKKNKRLANNPYWKEHNFARTVVKLQ